MKIRALEFSWPSPHYLRLFRLVDSFNLYCFSNIQAASKFRISSSTGSYLHVSPGVSAGNWKYAKIHTLIWKKISLNHTLLHVWRIYDLLEDSCILNYAFSQLFKDRPFSPISLAHTHTHACNAYRGEVLARDILWMRKAVLCLYNPVPSEYSPALSTLLAHCAHAGK